MKYEVRPITHRYQTHGVTAKKQVNSVLTGHEPVNRLKTWGLFTPQQPL